MKEKEVKVEIKLPVVPQAEVVEYFLRPDTITDAEIFINGASMIARIEGHKYAIKLFKEAQPNMTCFDARTYAFAVEAKRNILLKHHAFRNDGEEPNEPTFIGFYMFS